MNPWLIVALGPALVILHIYAIKYIIHITWELDLMDLYQVDVLDCHPYPVPISFNEFKKQYRDQAKKVSKWGF